jgi:VanZ family protein
MFSGPEFSASNTNIVLVRIIDLLHLKLTHAQFISLHFLIRKSAHFGAYALLSGLFFRALRGRGFVHAWQFKWMLFAVAVCFVTASADEVHQLFTPGRTGAGKDVLLDMSGALFMQLVIVSIIPAMRRRN